MKTRRILTCRFVTEPPKRRTRVYKKLMRGIESGRAHVSLSPSKYPHAQVDGSSVGALENSTTQKVKKSFFLLETDGCRERTAGAGRGERRYTRSDGRPPSAFTSAPYRRVLSALPPSCTFVGSGSAAPIYYSCYYYYYDYYATLQQQEKGRT